jgi:hypothetical protein
MCNLSFSDVILPLDAENLKGRDCLLLLCPRSGCSRFAASLPQIRLQQVCCFFAPDQAAAGLQASQ